MIAFARVSAVLLIALLAGCSTRPAWEDNRNAASVDYWFEQPAAVSVLGNDYRKLWDAAEAARKRFEFEDATVDYRNGYVSTEAAEGGTIFEPWRDAHRTTALSIESTLSRLRRTARFEFERVKGGWIVSPRVVLERYAVRYGPRRRSDEDRDTRFGWYATGRDVELERSIANRIAGDADADLINASDDVTRRLRR